MGTYVCIRNVKTGKFHPTWDGCKWTEFLNALDHTTGDWDLFNVDANGYNCDEPDRRPKDIDKFEVEMKPHINNADWLCELVSILRESNDWVIYYSY